jgi:hypothetical protein
VPNKKIALDCHEWFKNYKKENSITGKNHAASSPWSSGNKKIDR